MPKLDLRNARRIRVAGGEVARLKGPGGIVWARPAGAFDPATVFDGGKLGGIYDLSDASTLWQDTAATMQTGVGDIIRRLDDKSPNNLPLIARSDAESPLLSTDSGGRSRAFFAPSSDIMSTYQDRPPGVPFEFFVAYDPTGSNFFLVHARINDFPGGWFCLGASGDFATDQSDAQGTTEAIYADGVQIGSIGVARNTVFNAGQAARVLGARYTRNNSQSGNGQTSFGSYGSAGLPGPIYAILFVEGPITEQQRQDITVWMAAKAGRTLTPWL